MQFYGVGLNSGKFGYATSSKINGKWVNLHEYSIWSSMIKRCYSGELSCYDDVTVGSAWHDYQDFAKWYESQPDYRKTGNWQLDKDILNPASRVYCPENCRFVPTQINVLIRVMAEKEHVQGVNFHKRDKKFRAYLKDVDGKLIEKNGFETEMEAFMWYKVQKESVIKIVAELYKPLIDPDIYDALIKYKITSKRFINVT